MGAAGLVSCTTKIPKRLAGGKGSPPFPPYPFPAGVYFVTPGTPSRSAFALATRPAVTSAASEVTRVQHGSHAGGFLASQKQKWPRKSGAIFVFGGLPPFGF